MPFAEGDSALPVFGTAQQGLIVKMSVEPQFIRSWAGRSENLHCMISQWRPELSLIFLSRPPGTRGPGVYNADRLSCDLHLVKLSRLRKQATQNPARIFAVAPTEMDMQRKIWRDSITTCPWNLAIKDHLPLILFLREICLFSKSSSFPFLFTQRFIRRDLCLDNL